MRGLMIPCMQVSFEMGNSCLTKVRHAWSNFSAISQVFQRRKVEGFTTTIHGTLLRLEEEDVPA